MRFLETFLLGVYLCLCKAAGKCGGREMLNANAFELLNAGAAQHAKITKSFRR